MKGDNNISSPTSGPRALHVTGLPLDITEADVMRYFLPFGPVKALSLPRNLDGSLKGCARGLYTDPLDARTALANTNRGELAGCTLSVTFARLSEAEARREGIRRWQGVMDKEKEEKEV